MGLLDLFSKDTREQVEQTRSALDQAQAQQDASGLSAAATRLVENLLDSGIDGRGPFDSAADVAESARRERDEAEAAVDAVVASHIRMAAVGGFVTSLGGFITMPVSLPVNVLGFYLLATRMTAAVADLRGYDLSSQQIRSAVLLTLVGADSEDLLRKAGVVPTARVSNLAAQRLPGPLLMVVNKAVGFRLLSSAGRQTLARFGKAVPVVGGAIGAGLDGFLMKAIGDQARAEFPHRQA